jgi:hypothetical protein
VSTINGLKKVDENTGSVRTHGATASRERAEVVRLSDLIEKARNLEEIRFAIGELRTWVKAHPEYKGFLSDLFSGLERREEGAEQALAQARAMGLSDEEIDRREQVYQMVLSATADTPETIEKARIALEEWSAAHLNDPRVVNLRQSLDTEDEMAHLLGTGSGK